MVRPVCVLVVEDEGLIMLDVSEVFELAGFEVLCAANAAVALMLLTANPRIKAIFTDVNMPGMDGLMLAAIVHHRWPPIKIIVTSARRNIPLSELPPGGRFFDKPYDGMSVT